MLPTMAVLLIIQKVIDANNAAAVIPAATGKKIKGQIKALAHNKAKAAPAVSESESESESENTAVATATPVLKRPAAASVDVRPSAPTEHGTTRYLQGKVNTLVDKKIFRVFSNPNSRSDVKVEWDKFGGRKLAWNHALTMIEGFNKSMAKAARKS